MVKISVIVPCFKVEEYLEECIDSIINQDYENLEVIIVDDGSPDRCGEIADAYAARDSRVISVHQENGGLSAARNKGYEYATGEFVMFIDSDDFVEPGLFEYIDSHADEDVDIIRFGYRKYREGDGPCEQVEGNYRVLSAEEAYVLMSTYRGMTHNAWDKAYRREAIGDLRFIEGRIAEDLPYAYAILRQVRKIGVTDRIFYNYRIRGTSIMGSKSLKLYTHAYLGESEVREMMRETFPNQAHVRETRFFNVSLKEYTFIRQFCKGTEGAEEAMNEIFSAIRTIDWSNVDLISKILYAVFCVNKDLGKFILLRYLKARDAL